MVTLVDILRKSDTARNTQGLTMHLQIERDLNALQSELDLKFSRRQNEQETQKYSYREGLAGFLAGFNDGESGSTRDMQDCSSYFNAGYSQGRMSGNNTAQKIKQQE